MATGKSSPEPDACHFGVSRAQCHNRCGHRCSRARAERDAAARRALADTSALLFDGRVGAVTQTALSEQALPPYTASPSVAADHANCGTDSCCRRCTPTQGSPT